jgi:hypothetical protein
MWRVVPLVALVLLTWTAADLAYPQCCLAEQAFTTAGTDSQTQDERPDVDDCFCCARCIDTGTRVPQLRTALDWIEFVEPTRQLTTRSATLDHPPQNA